VQRKGGSGVERIPSARMAAQTQTPGAAAGSPTSSMYINLAISKLKLNAQFATRNLRMLVSALVY
jgi:hypothetical protein